MNSIYMCRKNLSFTADSCGVGVISGADVGSCNAFVAGVAALLVLRICWWHGMCWSVGLWFGVVAEV